MTLVESELAGRPNGADRHPPRLPVRSAQARSPIRPHPPETRERVKWLYENTDKRLDEIAAETGVGRTTMSDWARQEHWLRLGGGPATRTEGGGRDGHGRRARLMGRLYRVYGRQLATLEKRAGSGAAIDEKDARTLAVLAKTLETLIALDRDDGARTQTRSVETVETIEPNWRAPFSMG